MTFNENYHEMKPIEFDGLPWVFQHMKRVTRKQLFEGAEWPMSPETELKFGEEMHVDDFIWYSGDDSPGNMTWLANHCMWFAGIDDGRATATFIGELFLKDEFASALMIEDEAVRQSTIRAVAQRCFDQFWEELGVPEELVD
jgi:hypothetical protein